MINPTRRLISDWESAMRQDHVALLLRRVLAAGTRVLVVCRGTLEARADGYARTVALADHFTCCIAVPTRCKVAPVSTCTRHG